MTWKMGLLKEQVNDLIFWNVNYVAKLIHDGHSLKKKKKNIKTKLSIPFSNSSAVNFSIITIHDFLLNSYFSFICTIRPEFSVLTTP